MEEDLRAQEEFFRSGEIPSATVVRKNPDGKEHPEATTGIQLPSIVSPVREIKERIIIREKVNLETKPQDSGFPTAQRIDTQMRKGGKKSLFRQSMEEKAKLKQLKKNLQSKDNLEWSKEEEEKIKRSFSHGIKADEIQKDVDNMISQMSQQEIEDARKELLSSLDPSLISFLQKRGAYKASLQKEDLPKPTTENEQLQGRQIANKIDYSKIQTEEDLAAVVSLLPPSEQQKLEWTKPVRRTGKTNTIRFHFDGFIIPDTSSYSIQSGLYNHGSEGDRAGYTIGELVMLGRSAVSGQRVVALKCIYSILRRRSLAILYQQELKPVQLPVDLVHLLLFVLQRKAGLEETFLAVKCLEECCSSQEELYRRLLLNCTYHGYEHAHLQETALMGYEACEEEDEEEEEDVSNPFRRQNCGNIFSILYECKIVFMLFQTIQQNSSQPSVVNHCFNLLRILIESDKRFSDEIINSTLLFTQMENLLIKHISPAALPMDEKLIDPLSSDKSLIPDDNLSLRLFYLTNHSQSSLATILYAFLFIESLCRHNRRNAMNLYRSKVFSVVKEWLLFFAEDHSDSFSNIELNAVMEGVLSVWRIIIHYGLDEDGIDPFLPHLIRISQFAFTCNRVLVWEILEVTILHKRNVTMDYFIDFNNSIILLIVELLKENKVPIAIDAAMIHYYSTYIEVINDSMETWMAAGMTDTLIQSIHTQIVQLGFSILQLFKNLPSEISSSCHSVTKAWNAIQTLPKMQFVQETNVLNNAFSSIELTFLIQSNVLYAISRLVLSGIQNSRSFSAMLRECGWVDILLEYATCDFWKTAKDSPHSITYTYLPRLFILSQVNSILVLHTILPTESKTVMDYKQTNRFRVWKAAWYVIQSILPGDEYIALELLIHVLLNPVSIKLYLENHKEDASVNFDLDCLSEMLMQQLGEGKLIEHSQSLHLTHFSSRLSLRLLPYAIQPSLPLLPYWYSLPFFKLRFRKVNSSSANAFTVSTELQAVSLLQFVKEMEELLGEEDRVMRFYCLLHIVFAGMDIVSSSRISVLYDDLYSIYANTSISKSPCKCHSDCLSCLDVSVPKQEILSYLNQLCSFITDEYYYCPFALRVLKQFLYPCRDWNYRVLILNYFLDNNFAYLLLMDESQEGVNLEDHLKRCLKETECWETNEEMIEMYIRYFEQALKHAKNYKSVLFSQFFVNVIHYIINQYPRFNFFTKELVRLFPSLNIEKLLLEL